MDQDSQPPESGAMAAQNRARTRAPSRASTASMHSTTTQPNLEQSFAGHPNAYHDQWTTNGTSQPRSIVMPSQQMHAEEMMMRPDSQLHHSQSFPVNASMQSSVGSALSYAQHSAMNHHHGLSADSFGANTSFTDADSQMIDHDENEDGTSLADLPQNPKPTSNKSSANNELEMRALFQANRHRNLQEVATELHGNERGPNSERTRQVFAMLWINQVCTKGKGSVPRGRVYANYASRCATERITVLNPASFGKLVRVLFPGLKTRRLGVRGESKYHYVNFTLADDQVAEPLIQPAIPFPDTASFSQSFNRSNSQSPALNAVNKALPSPELPHLPNVSTVTHFSSSKAHSLYNVPDVSSIDHLHTTTAKTLLQLSFTPDDEEAFRHAEALILPKIESFLPENTDPDAAKSLAALYRAHCTSLVECIRYCKEKTFFHLYTSFQGTLTMPVQKLFSHPNIAPWIEQCDFLLYQRMMRIVSALVLQVVPKPVLDTLRNISERLVPHVRDAFQGSPRHVVQAKEAPAAIFAGLLDRALRVNLTAHAAANMLSHPPNRDQMYLDWITMVRIRKVAESVPTRGMDDTVNLLLGEIRGLLDPQNVPWEIECQTLYGDMLMRSGRTTQPGISSDDSPSNILDRWVNFLQDIPGKFPYASPKDIVWCVQRVGNEVMRDLTISQGKSFGSWWVTKCWLDEMISFIAEQRGFMHRQASSQVTSSQPRESISVDDVSRRPSQPANAPGELKTSGDAASSVESSRALFPAASEKHGRDSLGLSVNPDDSGIGMRTPEEELPFDKFDLPPNHSHELQTMGLDQQFQ